MFARGAANDAVKEPRGGRDHPASAAHRALRQSQIHPAVADRSAKLHVARHESARAFRIAQCAVSRSAEGRPIGKVGADSLQRQRPDRAAGKCSPTCRDSDGRRPNTTAVRVNAMVLFSRSCRSIEATPKANPACWSISRRAHSSGFRRGRSSLKGLSSMLTWVGVDSYPGYSFEA